MRENIPLSLSNLSTFSLAELKGMIFSSGRECYQVKTNENDNTRYANIIYVIT